MITQFNIFCLRTYIPSIKHKFRLTMLVEIYDEWTKIQQNKKLMKDAIQSKQSLITEASAWMVCQYWTLYAPWFNNHFIFVF